MEEENNKRTRECDTDGQCVGDDAEERDGNSQLCSKFVLHNEKDYQSIISKVLMEAGACGPTGVSVLPPVEEERRSGRDSVTILLQAQADNTVEDI